MTPHAVPSRPGWAWDGQTFTSERGSYRLEVKGGHAARWTLKRNGTRVASGPCYTAREGMDKAERHLEIEEQAR